MADLTSIQGVIGPTGNVVSGNGFAVTRTNTGEYQVQFKTQFAKLPAVVGSQVLFGGDNQDPRDNVVFPFLNSLGFTAIVGDSAGRRADRSFAFIAMAT